MAAPAQRHGGGLPGLCLCQASFPFLFGIPAILGRDLRLRGAGQIKELPQQRAGQQRPGAGRHHRGLLPPSPSASSGSSCSWPSPIPHHLHHLQQRHHLHPEQSDPPAPRHRKSLNRRGSVTRLIDSRNEGDGTCKDFSTACGPSAGRPLTRRTAFWSACPASPMRMEELDQPVPSPLPGGSGGQGGWPHRHLGGSDAKQVFGGLRGRLHRQCAERALHLPHRARSRSRGRDRRPVGEGVTMLEVGQRVVLNPWLSCVPRGIEPICGACRDGDYSLCWHFLDGPLARGIHTGTSKGLRPVALPSTCRPTSPCGSPSRAASATK